MKQKIAALVLVLLLLVAGLMKISDIVGDRQLNRNVAVQSVVQSLAGPQTLVGPLITRSCTEEWAASRAPAGALTLERREFVVVSAPTSLVIQGGTQLEPRSRGLHATQVFTLKSRIAAEWAQPLPALPTPTHADGRVTCAAPVMALSVSDARGLRHASLTLAGAAVLLKPGTSLSRYPSGVSATLPKTVADKPLIAEFDLELVGTERLAVVPVGDDTQVALTSNWPHPSFGGQFLPVTRQVTDHGFEADWRVSALASTAQQTVAQQLPLCSGNEMPVRYSSEETAKPMGCTDDFSVEFIDPVNVYVLSDRATKYGLLFVGLTFLAVGLFEFMKSLRVHPVQYLLVGAAMSMFFLLLVSLSEHMAFALAYALAASACVALLTYYASHMLGRWSRGLPFGLAIAVLYGLLYVLLQLEQTALLVGALALFALLAAIMAMTRQVDWYARLALPVKPAQTTQTPAA